MDRMTRKAVSSGPGERRRDIGRNQNGLRSQLSQTPQFTDDGPKTWPSAWNNAGIS